MKSNLLIDSNVKSLAYLIIGITCISINAWSKMPIGNTHTTWVLIVLFIFCSIRYLYKNKQILWNGNYMWCTIFLAWVSINIIRGAFIVENYWDYKKLVSGFFMCMLPLLAYIFRDPTIDAFLLKKWNKWMIFLFLFFFIWVCDFSCYFFLLPFILLYGCFFSELPRKWKIIVGIMLFLFCLDLSARSNVIKVAVTLITAIGFYFRNYLNKKVFILIHWGIYVITIILLVLGINGSLNFFEYININNEGEYVQNKNDGTSEDLSKDTRSFIYYEVISSAVNNNYVLFGRTPARGNDTAVNLFIQTQEEWTTRLERHANELVHLNIFTWLGIIGVVIYFFIYLSASYNAIYKSHNLHMKFIGLNIAFHWFYGWIEDYNSFTVQNLWIWMMIAMGLSSSFREMTDNEFRKWLKSILV